MKGFFFEVGGRNVELGWGNGFFVVVTIGIYDLRVVDRWLWGWWFGFRGKGREGVGDWAFVFSIFVVCGLLIFIVF